MTAVPYFLAIVRNARPSWQRDAACAEHPKMSWFAPPGADVRPQRAICQQCLVVRECRTYAIDNADAFGMWGATTARERGRIRQTGDR